MRYYALAQRPYITEPDGVSYYGLPDGVVGAVDLAPTGRSNWVFVTADKPFDSNDVELAIGDGSLLYDISLTTSERTAWESLLGVTYEPGWKLIDALWAVLTTQSDPDGEARCKPLVPTHRGVLELHLGGHSLIRSAKMPKKVTDLPHWPQLQRVLQNDYQRVKTHAQKHFRGKGEPDAHLKCLGAMQRKYGLTAEAVSKLVADGKDMPKKPTTTYIDTFDRADELLGASPASGGWTWVAKNFIDGSNLLDDHHGRVESNNLVLYGAYAHPSVGLSSCDMSSLLRLKSIAAAYGGPAVRLNSAAGTGYKVSYYASKPWLWLRRLNGWNSATGLANPAWTLSVDDFLQIKADGSTITVSVNGSAAYSLTDTVYTDIYPGVSSQAAAAAQIADNFEASDLLTPVPFNAVLAANNNQIIGAGL